jgi:hypothetical protein
MNVAPADDLSDLRRQLLDRLVVLQALRLAPDAGVVVSLHHFKIFSLVPGDNL